MFFKKFKKTCTLILLTCFIFPYSVFAYSDYLVASGENVGIELNAKGVMIVGSYKVQDHFPAKDAGLKVGDIIIKINDKDASTINKMVEIINETTNNSIKVTYLRGNKQNQTTLTLVKDESNILKTGLYVKDSITGVGTITFIDPQTKIFGALGHEIAEKSTGQILEIKDGKIYDSTVTSIDRSTNGTPGEKNARYYSNKIKGNLYENTNKGIFGNYTDTIDSTKLYKVAKKEEIKSGEAYIKTVLDGKEVGEYKINILKINNSAQKTKNLTFEITDPVLLEKTGGIVQGMSGSPIIQGDNIIGAVTHVVVDSPTKGYGIFITNMLEEAEN